MAKNEKMKKDDDTLFIGIDLGTSKTAINASNGLKVKIPSVVGWPKDIISRKLLKKDILIGEDALKNRLSLNLYKPLENGVIKESIKDKSAATELLKHAISIARKGEEKRKIFVIVGAPAQTDHINKTTLIGICRELADSVMTVSEPFAVSYSLERMNHTLIVDMGAGTIDLCRMHGTLPEDGDEISLSKAGDHVDRSICELTCKNYKGAGVTQRMAQKWKDEFGFVGPVKAKIEVEVPLDGKDTKIDITNEVKESCESVLDDMVNAIKGLISTYDPEFQTIMKKNVILAGRLSRMDGMADELEKRLSGLGEIHLELVDDAIFCGAKGAMMLAEDIPMEHWNVVMFE